MPTTRTTTVPATGSTTKVLTTSSPDRIRTSTLSAAVAGLLNFCVRVN